MNCNYSGFEVLERFQNSFSGILQQLETFSETFHNLENQLLSETRREWKCCECASSMPGVERKEEGRREGRKAALRLSNG